MVAMWNRMDEIVLMASKVVVMRWIRRLGERDLVLNLRW